MVFSAICPHCDARVILLPDLFAGIRYETRDGEPFVLDVDRASHLHPLWRSKLPVVEAGCANCGEPIKVMLAIGIISPAWENDAQIRSDLVGQAPMALVHDEDEPSRPRTAGLKLVEE